MTSSSSTRFRANTLTEIVDLQVAKLIGRVAERGISISLTESARELLGNMGYDPTYGARPLKRVIQRNLVDPLALGLLQGNYAEGDRVVIDAAEGALWFECAGAAVAAG